MAIPNNVIADRVPGDSITASMFNTVKNGLAPEIHNARHLRGGLDAVPRVGEVGGLTAPAACTLSKIFGAAGSISTIQSSAIVDVSEDTITWHHRIDFSGATVAGQNEFAVNAPSGWVVATALWSAYPLGNLGNYLSNSPSTPNRVTLDMNVGHIFYSALIVTLRKT